jgi:TRAP-type C4-dicarboxylate transport system permease small subunit
MSAPTPEPHLIHVEEEEARIVHYPEDWLAFVLFWIMGFVVFLQFFTRYVLNDALAWTEEIARYFLMWVTFVGAAVAMRRRTHIGVELLLLVLPERPARFVNFLVDFLVLAFVALLCWYSITITERMHIQRMTVFDWPMSIVYGGIGIGCALLLWRAVQMFIANLRRGWRPDPARTGLIMD